ncbi:MAG TPA: amidase family protein, partial [Actinomycetota bacterium]
AGPDGLDGDVPPVPLGSPRRVRLRDLRLAVAPTLPGATVAGAVRQQVERVAAEAADAGARVEERLPGLDWTAFHRLFGGLLEVITGVVDPQASLGDEQRSLLWYLDALERRDRFAAVWERFFEDLDALLLPATMTSALTHRESGAPIEVDGERVDYGAQGLPLVFGNLTGLPGLAVPAGLDGDGLPVGVQLVGPRWSEMRLLGIAGELERAGILPGFQAPPDP